jgi:hypothetical protein
VKDMATAVANNTPLTPLKGGIFKVFERFFKDVGRKKPTPKGEKVNP